MVEGRVVAGRYTRLACERHLRDLETAHERGFWYDAEVVEDLELFFSGLPHSKGEWAGRAIELEDWQAWVLGMIFGWKRADGTRRFRSAYVEVAKKNGKSTLAAGVALLLAFFDDEPGAEVYCAATKRDQAKIVWGEARRMVLKTPALAQRITVLTSNLSDHITLSKLEPLGADADSTEGINPSAAIIDELHAHKTRAMLDVIETAGGARRQPLVFVITTAGSNRVGPCYDQRTYLTKVLDQVHANDATFGVIYTLDELDDWTDEKVWVKANPNLGVSVKLDTMRDLAAKAKETPSAQAAFKTKRLNVWVNADFPFFDMALWHAAATTIRLEDFAADPCVVGLDLASKSDLAGRVAAWKRGEDLYLATRFFLPRQPVVDGQMAETAHYMGWATAGHLTLTEGNIIDFDFVREDLQTLAKRTRVRQIAFDQYQAAFVAAELEKVNLPRKEIPQTVKHLSAPMKAFRDLLKAGKVHHDGNPVMAWCISNVVAHEDVNENVFPRKAARDLKIDGFSALLNALTQLLVPAPKTEPRVWVVG